MVSNGTSVDGEDGGGIAFLKTGAPVVGFSPDGNFDVISTSPVEGLDIVGVGEVMVEADFSNPPHEAWSSNRAMIPRAEDTL